MWNTDATRFHYIVRDLITEKVDWTIDKNGIKIKEYVITPILTYIRAEIVEYAVTFGNNGKKQR
jgi:hypothetical protein